MVWGEDVRSLENFAEESVAPIWKLVIDGNVADLRSQLNMLGFVESMVYPELASLAAELSRVEGWRAAQ